MLAGPLRAQATGIAVVDSAAVARAASARANRALRDNNLADAHREMARAASAWPKQPAYVWAHAVLSARSRDTAALRAALATYSAMGLGRDLRADSMFRLTLPEEEFETIAQRLDMNRAPRARSSVHLRMQDSTFWPEGIDVDEASGRIWLTSVRHGTILELPRSGAARELIPRHTPRIGAILAVRFDAAHDLLWATTSGISQMQGYRPADSAIAALLAIKPSDGAIVKRIDLPPGQHVLGDVAVASNGDVFFSDSKDPALYWLKSGADTVVKFTSPLMRSPQGIAPRGDNKAVYLADYSHGLLLVDLSTKRVEALPSANGVTTTGLDGINLQQNAIIGIQNGVAPARLMRFVIEDGRVIRGEVIDQNTAVADEPTIGTITSAGYYYVANSQWEKHDDNGAPLPSAVRTPPVVLLLPAALVTPGAAADSATTVRVVMSSTVEKIWAALPRAYKDIGLTVNAIDSASHTVGYAGEIRGRLKGVRLSTYFRCGSQMGDNADTYDIRLFMATQLGKDESGRLIVKTSMRISARSPAFASTTTLCSTTGELERRLNDAIRSHIGR